MGLKGDDILNPEVDVPKDLEDEPEEKKPEDAEGAEGAEKPETSKAVDEAEEGEEEEEEAEEGAEAVALTPQDLERANEEFMDEFYKNPLGAMAKLVQTLVERNVAPIQAYVSQQTLQQRVDRFAAQHSDFNDLKDEMVAVLKEHPELASLPNSIEVVYHAAKGRRAEKGEAEAGKRAAGVPARGGKPAPSKVSEEDLIKKAIMQYAPKDPFA